MDDVNRELAGISSALHALGVGNAGTNMGAIEFLAVQVREGLDGLAEAVNRLAMAVEDTPIPTDTKGELRAISKGIEGVRLAIQDDHS